jgi:hypothetical protein
VTKSERSYWISGSYAPALSEKHNSFLRLLKNKDFKEESMTKVGLDAIGTSTTLESNKSQQQMQWSKLGAHLLLQTRVKTLDGELGAIFKRWYPDMDLEVEEMPAAA